MIIIIAVEVLPVFGQQPKPSQIMDQYRAQRVTWTTNIWPYANTLFGILATIEFAWSCRDASRTFRSPVVDFGACSKDDVDRRILWLLLNGRTWIPAIIDSFEQIGQTSSGFKFYRSK